MLKTVLIVIAAVIAVLAAAGFLFYKFARGRLIGKYVAGRPGNAAAYSASAVVPDMTSPLRGMKAICLGSSVTYGAGSCGESFAEFLKAKDGVEILAKEAVGGTTLATQGSDSYIPRMETIDRTLRPDVFICQLSTNDASKQLPLGEISGSAEPGSFDTSTVAGAIEYIIVYAKNTWSCPVIFYTGTVYDSEQYGRMVALLLRLREKWGIGVIDQWNNAELNDIPDEKRKLYMLDGIHPTRAGYLEWWLPQFEAALALYAE